MLTPVTVLTGFLGSGKTTLLNSMLKSPALADTAVLINEFGSVPIDHLLVRSSTEQVMVLDSGCICCNVQGDLVQALRDLHFKRAKGEVPTFRRVIIETTGLADPAPILHTLIQMPVLSARYSLSGVVTTVDAVHGEAQLSRQFESVKQAAVADRIVMTKIDQADAATAARLKARLERLNPTARIFAAVNGDIDPDGLLDTALYQTDGRSPDVARWLGMAKFRPVAPARIGSGAPVATAPSHDSDIRTYALSFDAPVDFDGLIDGLQMIMTLRGDQLLRMKGIVNARGGERPKVLHAVQHTLYPDATLPAWPDADRRTRLVFIVRGLEEQFIATTLQHFAASAPEAAPAT
ncbi:MAG: GTP-binding protein [Betaproteobacteria bacterium]|nr:GTP-binding protein [Betaproteobacteria bacterium]